MMIRIAILIACCLSFLIVDTADAIGRRRRARRNRTYYSNYTYTNYYTFSGTTPQQVAEQKVALLARLGYGFHPGGGYGGGYYEGWGMGATAEQARWSTCNGANCLSARGSAVAWSPVAGCWFAINIW